MRLPFLNRVNEIAILDKALKRPSPSFVCVYGRRRCGKSRLILQAIQNVNHAYYIGDTRDAAIQRRACAIEISRTIPGFDSVEYPGWEQLFDRWYGEAPEGAALVIDEFPFLVSSSGELPGILQKFLDTHTDKPVHLILCGSSQRMMQGLVLNGSAPLYGRATDILKIEPLGLFYTQDVFSAKHAKDYIELYSYFGGIPRYWELAQDFSSPLEAVRELVLNPHGVLYREPDRLLADELRDTHVTSTLLSLIGQGSHRLSEIAARINKPSTSLTRPLASLLEMGLIKRDIPFGENPKSTKKSLYKINDPFLNFWYRFVGPNRSLLESYARESVFELVEKTYPQHLGEIWEELARKSVAHLTIGGEKWRTALRWWGGGTNKRPLEIDIVAESLHSNEHFLVGEVKTTCSAQKAEQALSLLKQKADVCPLFHNKKVTCALWVLNEETAQSQENRFSALDVLQVLR